LCEVYVVDPAGCNSNATKGKLFDAQNRPCDESRGLTFQSAASRGWANNSNFNVGVYQTFNNIGSSNLTVEFGFDSFSTGFLGTGGLTAPQSVIAKFADFYASWTGLLGIDPRPTNFTNLGGYKAPQSNFMTILNKTNMIPSVSFAYTAGSNGRRSF
jgi:hypothetical protein